MVILDLLMPICSIRFPVIHFADIVNGNEKSMILSLKAARVEGDRWQPGVYEPNMNQIT